MLAAGRTPIDPDDPGKGCVQMRIGLNSGPCMASVVGRRNPKFTLFGDTVNTASRMESTSLPGRIQCTARTAELIRAQDPGLELLVRGEVEVKGKGTLKTFWVPVPTRTPGPKPDVIQVGDDGEKLDPSPPSQDIV
jgi:guanylate cyclase, other